jgi:hypothetical protein
LEKAKMRIFCAAVFVALVAITTHGQGTVDFHNTGTTLITTNDFQGHNGLISGAGNYRFGLYVGPFGSGGGSLTLVGLATNISIAGLFGTSGNAVSSGFPTGTQVSFQVRGWSSFAGNSFEQAYTYAANGIFPIAYIGQSALGFFTVPSSGSVVVFGTGPGQVGGFALTPIPEPSMFLLSGFALLMFAGLRQRCAKAKVN